MAQSFSKMGSNVNKFIKFHQDKNITNRNLGTPVIPKPVLTPVANVDMNLSPVNKAKKKKRKIPVTLRG